MVKSQEVQKELKNFNSFFNRLAQRHDAPRVFDDLLTIIVCCFAHGTQEELYFNAIKPYNRQEMETLAKAMAELLLLYNKAMVQHTWTDPLGDYYELLAGRYKKSRLGQFFTPKALCDMIAQMTLTGADWSATVNDPCCGSGRFILASNNVVSDITYTAQDIDPICCKMTAINMAFHHIKGTVYQMDTIRMDAPVRVYQINPYWAKAKTPHILIKRVQTI